MNIAEYLFSKGADVNLKKRDGQTALYYGEQKLLKMVTRRLLNIYGQKVLMLMSKILMDRLL
jgi:hypothetical protein